MGESGCEPLNGCCGTGFVICLVAQAGMVWLSPEEKAVAPASPQLAAADPAAVVAQRPARPLAEPIQAARALYERRCQSCHGADGTGTALRDRNSSLPDFTDRRWHDGHTDAQLVASILEGKGSRMPSFRRSLKEEQAQDLVEHAIRAFASRKPSRGSAGTSDFEKQFRQLEEQMDRLKKQFAELSARQSNP
jgi:mono/diheme cytochrome c family protein